MCGKCLSEGLFFDPNLVKKRKKKPVSLDEWWLSNGILLHESIKRSIYNVSLGAYTGKGVTFILFSEHFRVLKLLLINEFQRLALSGFNINVVVHRGDEGEFSSSCYETNDDMLDVELHSNFVFLGIASALLPEYIRTNGVKKCLSVFPSVPALDLGSGGSLWELCLLTYWCDREICCSCNSERLVFPLEGSVLHAVLQVLRQLRLRLRLRPRLQTLRHFFFASDSNTINADKEDERKENSIVGNDSPVIEQVAALKCACFLRESSARPRRPVVEASAALWTPARPCLPLSPLSDSHSESETVPVTVPVLEDLWIITGPSCRRPSDIWSSWLRGSPGDVHTEYVDHLQPYKRVPCIVSQWLRAAMRRCWTQVRHFLPLSLRFAIGSSESPPVTEVSAGATAREVSAGATASEVSAGAARKEVHWEVEYTRLFDKIHNILLLSFN